MDTAPDRDQIMAALREGEVTVQGQFLAGSNYTFMGVVNHQDLELPVVYKPVRGEQPLWDFPAGSLARREVAAYLISEALRWQLVPPTIFRRKLPLGAGSLQQYIEHDPEYHYFTFDADDKQRLQPVVLFDLLTNNADRKGSHILKDAQGHIWLIDHGVCFHEEDKIRTVVWDFAGSVIPASLLDDLRVLVEALKKGSDLYARVTEMITPVEVAAMKARALRLVEGCKFPHPGGSHRPYPWPPV